MHAENENLHASSLLLVDDDPGTIQILRRMLSPYRDIRFATSGTDALQLVRTSPPDLILLDYEMPDFNGVETFTALRNDSRLEEIPVIFVTGRAEPEVESEVLNLGAADFITKPINELVVRARVRTQLRLKQLSDQLRDYAWRDALTGIANRRAFVDALEREWRRSQRAGSSLSVMLIDVDHFKRYNDAEGHLLGDQALTAVAGCLGPVARRGGDLVARYGGEEFAVVLPETGLADAEAIANSMCSAVSKLRIPHPASPTAPWLTVSIGVSAAVPEAGRESDPTHRLALLHSADEALYAAKAAGRNRCIARLAMAPPRFAVEAVSADKQGRWPRGS